MEQNKPFLLRCPPRAYSYRVTYDWVAQSSQISIAKDPLLAPRILMEPSGDLLFSFVNSSELSPVRCRVIDLFGRSTVGPPMYFTVIPGISRPFLCLVFDRYDTILDAVNWKLIDDHAVSSSLYFRVVSCFQPKNIEIISMGKHHGYYTSVSNESTLNLPSFSVPCFVTSLG